jgi:hypothetical protein
MTTHASLLAFLCLLGCAGSNPATNDEDRQDQSPSTFDPPADWTTYLTRCSFSFRAPPGTTEQTVMGIDSCVTRYTVDDCDLAGDYGGYSDSLTGNEDRPGYSNEHTRIDGLDATLVRFDAEADADGGGVFAAGVHFARVTGDRELTVKFTFYATCDSESGRATMLDLFKTIDFDD